MLAHVNAPKIAELKNIRRHMGSFRQKHTHTHTGIVASVLATAPPSKQADIAHVRAATRPCLDNVACIQAATWLQ